MKLLCWIFGHKWGLKQVWKDWGGGNRATYECARCKEWKTIEE